MKTKKRYVAKCIKCSKKKDIKDMEEQFNIVLGKEISKGYACKKCGKVEIKLDGLEDELENDLEDLEDEDDISIDVEEEMDVEADEDLIQKSSIRYNKEEREAKRKSIYEENGLDLDYVYDKVEYNSSSPNLANDIKYKKRDYLIPADRDFLMVGNNKDIDVRTYLYLRSIGGLTVGYNEETDNYTYTQYINKKRVKFEPIAKALPEVKASRGDKVKKIGWRTIQKQFKALQDKEYITKEVELTQYDARDTFYTEIIGGAYIFPNVEKNFVSVNFGIMNKLIQHLNSDEIKVYIYYKKIYQIAKIYGNEMIVSRERICRELNMSNGNTVIASANKKLEELGIIQLERCGNYLNKPNKILKVK